MSTILLQNNKVNYITDPIIYSGDNIYNCNIPIKHITYNATSNTSNTNVNYIYYNIYVPAQQNQYTFNIMNKTCDITHCKCCYNMLLSFACSNFTAIKDTDTLTVSVQFDNNTHNYKYPLQKHCLNFINIFDYIDYNGKLTSINISATSTCQLTTFEPKSFAGIIEPMINVIFMAY